MFSQEVADRVCERLAQGHSLRQAAEAEGVHNSTVMQWARDNDAFAKQYARAREIGYDLDFEQLEELAAEPPPQTASGSTDAGWVQWKRLQIDTKKWALSKKAPKKYGDKVETTHQVGDSVTKFVREIVRA
jgi:transposase